MPTGFWIPEAEKFGFVCADDGNHVETRDDR
jgi:hypothetical protein